MLGDVIRQSATKPEYEGAHMESELSSWEWNGIESSYNNEKSSLVRLLCLVARASCMSRRTLHLLRPHPATQGS